MTPNDVYNYMQFSERLATNDEQFHALCKQYIDRLPNGDKISDAIGSLYADTARSYFMQGYKTAMQLVFSSMSDQSRM